jgi:hypothetical protein
MLNETMNIYGIRVDTLQPQIYRFSFCLQFLSIDIIQGLSLILEDGTVRLSLNVGNKLPLYAA